MTETPYRKTTDLPEVFPVFPLAGALLLPRGRLPLNVFEPRYLNMVDDALASRRLIGMIQPVASDDLENPGLFPVGCIGRITAFRETGDGRYLITLTGLCRFNVSEELPCTTPYRQVHGDFTPYTDDLLPAEPNDEIGRDRLLEALKAYLGRRRMDTDWDAIQKASNEGLVNSLSMIGEFNAEEKQLLLEAQTLAKRAEILTALIEFANAASRGAPDAPLQ